MRVLKIRTDSHLYTVKLPEGTIVQPRAPGPPEVYLPGPTPEDTMVIVPGRLVVRAARQHMHGLELAETVLI